MFFIKSIKSPTNSLKSSILYLFLTVQDQEALNYFTTNKKHHFFLSGSAVFEMLFHSLTLLYLLTLLKTKSKTIYGTILHVPLIPWTLTNSATFVPAVSVLLNIFLLYSQI